MTILCRNGLNHREFHAFHFGDLRGNLSDVRRLIAFAALRMRRKIRRVRFDEDTFQRQRPRDLLQAPRVLKCHRSSEGNVITQSNRLLRHFQVARKAVQHAVGLAVPAFKNVAHSAVGIAVVDHDRHTQFFREIEMRDKISFLYSARRTISIMKIQADLTDGNYFTLLHQRADFFERRAVKRFGVVRVNANGRVNNFVFVRKRHCRAARFHVCSCGDDRRDAGLCRTRDHRVQVVCKLFVVEMAVRVNVRHVSSAEDL